MFARIIDGSIRNRPLVLVGAMAVVIGGAYALARTPVDAIPDLSDVQVIIQTDYPGQAPRIVEDQVTYPVATQMLAAPFAEVVRGYSFFGVSFVYVIFEDGTDLYWARSRVLEYLNTLSGQLPPGVTSRLGPDATGVGWAFVYALRSDRHDLGELRSIQDWFLKYELTAVPGVSEVASVGGFVRQYQVTVDPNRLRAYGLSISAIRAAIQESNSDVGGGLIEVAESEFMIRGLGYIRSVEDIRSIGLGVSTDGTPILLEDVARVGLGPEGRRGLAEWNGEGETVGGIVVVRSGADVREVIRGVKARLAEVAPGLPEGVEVEVAYDRTALIDRAVGSIRTSLAQQLVIVGLICLVFLFHLRSGLVAVIALPVGILMALIVARLQGLTLNIMSLGGIAVAIGTMVDAGIVMVENAHKHVARDGGRRPHWEVVASAAQGGGPLALPGPARDHRVVRAGLRLGSAGGTPLQAARVHEDLRDGVGRSALAHAGPRASGLLGEGQHTPALGHPPGEAARPDVRAAPGPGAEAPRLGAGRRGGGARRHRGTALAPGLGVHAAALGGRPPLHAHDPSRGLDHRGARDPSADGPDHLHVPRGPPRIRQGRPRRVGDRPRAALHARDHHRAQAPR